MSTIVLTGSTSEGVRYPSPWINHQEIPVEAKGWFRHSLAQDWILWRRGVPREPSPQTDLANSIRLARLYPEETSNVTFEVENLLNWLLQNQVVVPEPREVRDYLLRYPDITGLLPFVCRLAWERLGMHTQLSLEVYHDPEIQDEYLTLYVRRPHYEEHLISAIEDVCAEYEAELVGKSGWLLVTTDFRPPR